MVFREKSEIVVEKSKLRRWRGKLLVSLNCPFHDDKHPSAFILLLNNHTCIFKCHACGKKAKGTWHKTDSQEIAIRLGKHVVSAVKPRAVSPTGSQNNALALLSYVLKMQILEIKSGLAPRPSSIMTKVLAEKLHNKPVPDVENPPIIGLGIFFRLWSLSEMRPIDGFHIRVNAVPKALTFVSEQDKSQVFAYLPNPSQVIHAPTVCVVESPFNALRIARWNFASVASLGKQRLELIKETLRQKGKRSLVIADEFPSNEGFLTFDPDRMEDEELLEVLCQFQLR